MNKKLIILATIVAIVVITAVTGYSYMTSSSKIKTIVVEKEQNIEIRNPNYKVYVETSDIIYDTSKLGGVFAKYYTKFIQYIAPNGNPITIVAQDQVSDEQVLKAFNQLSFYLEDYGDYKKSNIANQMANNHAILVMPNGADGESDINPLALQGQPLYQMEVPTVGSEWYIENDYEHRDAAYEEILHLVHDYGIGTVNSKGATPELQKEIYAATMNALPRDKTDWGKTGLWGLGAKDWLNELSREGSLEQEYLASVVDSYYGLWAPYTGSEGGMWGVYTSKTREEIKKKDPMGYKIINEFLPDNITYMARIDADFDGTFSMTLNEDEPYTYKSKYLQNARLLGDNNSNLTGNDLDNILMGNSGNNIIDGMAGIDVVQFDGSYDEYSITKSGDTLTVMDKLNRHGKNTLINIEILRFRDQDVNSNEKN